MTADLNALRELIDDTGLPLVRRGIWIDDKDGSPYLKLSDPLSGNPDYLIRCANALPDLIAELEQLRAEKAAPRPDGERHAPDELTRTAPERIWLQISDDEEHRNEPFPTDHEGITWCQDSVLACEVAYVRADALAALRAERDALAKDAERGRWLQHYLEIHSDKEGDWTCWLAIACIPMRRDPKDANAVAMLDDMIARWPLKEPDAAIRSKA